jgi:hypothetical protein
LEGSAPSCGVSGGFEAEMRSSDLRSNEATVLGGIEKQLGQIVSGVGSRIETIHSADSCVIPTRNQSLLPSSLPFGTS